MQQNLGSKLKAYVHASNKENIVTQAWSIFTKTKPHRLHGAYNRWFF